MTVANPREVPEYELNPLDIQIRRGDGISKVWSSVQLPEHCTFVLQIEI